MRSYEDKPWPFGEHKGELICDLPNSYLEWIMDQKWFSDGRKFEDLRELVEMETEYRERNGIEI